MLRILLDQDFDHDIVRGLLQRLPDLDFIAALQLGLSRADDRRLLLRVAVERRILLTHDVRTMPGHYFGLLQKGETLEGAFIVPRRLKIGTVIDNLEILIVCSEQEDWENTLNRLPL